jgi:predicted DNA-binding protein YlxM (UPF0122 family)
VTGAGRGTTSHSSTRRERCQLDLDLDPEELDGRFVEEPDPGKSPYRGLISWELRRIEARSGMTQKQACVFDLWLVQGASLAEIGRTLSITRTSVLQHLRLAQAKAARYPHLGLLSTLVEVFGWRAVRDAILDRERRNTA